MSRGCDVQPAPRNNPNAAQPHVTQPVPAAAAAQTAVNNKRSDFNQRAMTECQEKQRLGSGQPEPLFLLD